LTVVVVLAAHLCIFCDPLFPGLPADHGSSHGASDQAADSHNDRGCENKIGAPGHVGNEEKNIDKKAQQTGEEVDNANNEDDQKVPG